MQNDSTTPTDTLMEFPCPFQLKVMGYNKEEFAQQMREITQTFVSDPIKDADIDIRASRTKKFLSVNISFTAQNKQQLDDIYKALTEHELVTMAL